MIDAVDTSTNVKSRLLYMPERRRIDAEAALKMAVKCPAGNDQHGEKRNFKCVEFNGVKFKNEDLSCIAAHYSKFTDCEFEECNITSSEFYFAELKNCLFKNCDLSDSSFTFAAVSCIGFFNCILNDADFSFARGNFSCNSCLMRMIDAQNADLFLMLSHSDAYDFKANSASLDLDVFSCNFRIAEFNESILKGKIVQTDLTRAEMNHADLSGLELTDSATRELKTENAIGLDEPADDLESILNEEQKI